MAGDRPLPASGAPLSAATLDALVDAVDAAVIDAAAGWEGSEALVLDLAGRLAAGVEALARRASAHPRAGETTSKTPVSPSWAWFRSRQK